MAADSSANEQGRAEEGPPCSLSLPSFFTLLLWLVSSPDTRSSISRFPLYTSRQWPSRNLATFRDRLGLLRPPSCGRSNYWVVVLPHTQSQTLNNSLLFSILEQSCCCGYFNVNRPNSFIYIPLVLFFKRTLANSRWKEFNCLRLLGLHHLREEP